MIRDRLPAVLAGQFCTGHYLRKVFPLHVIQDRSKLAGIPKLAAVNAEILDVLKTLVFCGISDCSCSTSSKNLNSLYHTERVITISTFIPFTDQQLQQAKHTDLAAFLEARGEQLKRSGSELEWADHHVTIRGNQFFDQYEQRGGTAIDFVRKYFDASFQDAVQMLLGQNIAAAPVKPRQREREPFALPPKNENMRRVYAYLLKQRCIDRAVLDHFAHQKLIYESADYHNAVFVGTDEEGTPRHAHKRSTASQGSWRANQTGSEAAHAFHHIGTSGVIYAFEAPVDTLSFISLYQQNWQQHSYVALCGVSADAIRHQLTAHENLREVVLCLDNDEAGHAATECISQAFPVRKNGLTFSVCDIAITILMEMLPLL